MPEMMEIYKKYNFEYDELVKAEDYQHRLTDFIQTEFEWKGKTVMEAGIGTGRVSRFYLDEAARLHATDREAHMLEGAGKNLEQWKDKIDLITGDNLNLPFLESKADMFIEGWSFGHTIIESGENYKEVFASIYKRILRNLIPNGTIIIIETMGTNVEKPAPPLSALEAFYRLLIDEYDFTRTVISTDYRFKTVEEAARITGFFFGEAMSQKVKAENRTIIPEYTGVFYKTL